MSLSPWGNANAIASPAFSVTSPSSVTVFVAASIDTTVRPVAAGRPVTRSVVQTSMPGTTPVTSATITSGRATTAVVTVVLLAQFCVGSNSPAVLKSNRRRMLDWPAYLPRSIRACRQLAESNSSCTCWLSIRVSFEIFDDTDAKAGSSASLESAVDFTELFVATTSQVAPPSVETKTRALSRIVSSLPEALGVGVWSQ